MFLAISNGRTAKKAVIFNVSIYPRADNWACLVFTTMWGVLSYNQLKDTDTVSDVAFFFGGKWQ